MGSHLHWAWSWAAGRCQTGCARHACQLERQGRLVSCTQRGPEASFPGLKYLRLLESESWPAGLLLSDQPVPGATSPPPALRLRPGHPEKLCDLLEATRLPRVALWMGKRPGRPFHVRSAQRGHFG